MNDQRSFFENHLRPLLSSEKVFLDNAEQAEQRGQLAEATLFIKSVLVLNPNNQVAREKLKQLKKLKVRHLAHDFIKTFYPAELDLFDIAWRLFNDILPADFHREALSGALGIVGDQATQLESPKAIVLLNAVNDRSMEGLSDDETSDIVADIAQQVGCPQKLTQQLRQFILEQ